MKHIHLIGIGGTGLSAIARVLLERGYTVSGSDRAESQLAKELHQAGVRVFIGHDENNIAGADLIVRSSAITEDNPEVIAARAAGIPVLKRSEFLGTITADKRVIAIAGTHGKTTTTTMIAWVLTHLGLDPSYIIGGVSKNLGNNAHAGKGDFFVVEADEYDHMFLGLQPEKIVITSMEHDHPDCFPTPEDYQKAFTAFIRRIQPGGTVLICRDDYGAYSLMSAIPSTCQALDYGTEGGAIYRGVALRSNSRGGFDFTACFENAPLAQVSLCVPGEHNVRNSLAALAIAHQLGLSVTQAADALKDYRGTGRRFEILGEISQITIIDDYAHHPTEIKATLAAARSRYPERRIWAVWQPHTYSRTRTLQEQFSSSFQDADRVIVTEIYAAREPKESFSAAQVVEQMQHPAARFIPGLAETAETLLDELKPGDVLLVLSAGDADQISARVLAGLQERLVSND